MTRPRGARMALRGFFYALSILATIGACGGSAAPASPSAASTPLVFTVAPIDPAAIQFIVPLGNMAPWGHTLPTDHAYVYHHLQAGAFAPLTVLAPAAGIVDGTYPGAGGEVKIWVRVSATTTYYFDHVVPAAGIAVGSRIAAGSILGSSGGIAFDFAVRDEAASVGFLNPARYGLDTLYGHSPFGYFVEPLRSALYAKVQRSGGEPDGRFNYDVSGALSGNWFAEDLPVAQSSGADMSIGTRQLAFARDVRTPDRQRISIGGLGLTGLYGVPPDAPDFSAVTAVSGVVVYRLLELGEPGGVPGIQQLGLLAVQVLDAQRLRVEARPDRNAATMTFSAAASIYLR